MPGRLALLLLALVCTGCQVNRQSERPADAAPEGTVIVTPVKSEVGRDEATLEWRVVGDRKWVWGTVKDGFRIRYAYPLGTSESHGGKHVWTVKVRLRRVPEEGGRFLLLEERTLVGDLPEAKQSPILETYNVPIEGLLTHPFDKRPLTEAVTVLRETKSSFGIPTDVPLYEVRFLDREGKDTIEGVRLKVME
ncbi:MAG: hypothetical protein KIS66_16230 [Fimbriimonadaceae bacterium]|nr:hypothetical protein [Fimbriimonadaceae bacterium]